VKNFIKKSVFSGIVLFIFSGIISCEKDFTDIGTSIINNSEFSTKDTILEVIVTSAPITSVRAGGLSLQGRELGQYLLGVYNNPNYEKIEASIVSQLAISTSFKIIETLKITDTTSVHTELDAVILRIPYQATLNSKTEEYRLDSIIGDREVPFTLNVYELSTYLHSLNPSNPTQGNTYQSDDMYTTIGSPLNIDVDYQFIPNKNDTMFVFDRKLSTGATFKDTIKLIKSAPFARIPLNKAKFQEFMDNYDSSEFDSQDAFNDYFRGVMLRATGNDGSLLSLKFSKATNPSIELYFTNTITLDATGAVLDTVKKNHSFQLSGIKNSVYEMTAGNGTTNNNFVIQGTAGNMGEIEIFGQDVDANGIPDQIDELRPKNWLINDASLTFYVDQNVVAFDTITTPYRLFLYKNGTKPSQIKDMLSEGFDLVGGKRELSDDKKPNKYTFRITDYVSDLLSGKTDYAPVLGLKVFNPTDGPASAIDTVIKTYNWNPKTVMLLNHQSANGIRRAQLKISYTEKK